MAERAPYRNACSLAGFLDVATETEIAWAAGLFEGEGSITYIPRGLHPDLQVAINMTDEDVVRRFEAVVDRGRVYGPYHPPSHGDRRKPFWRWMATGDAGHDVLDALDLWLSPRRVAQARLYGVSLTGYEGQKDADSRT
jgi:hypothetical protein